MEVIEKKDPYASQKKYYQKHKAEINAAHRRYYQANRDEINEHNKARYHANREEIIPIRRQKFDRELCGGRYTYDHRGQHFGSKMHRNALAKATEEISSIALRIVDIQGIDKRTMEQQMTTMTELANMI